MHILRKFQIFSTNAPIPSTKRTSGIDTINGYIQTIFSNPVWVLLFSGLEHNIFAKT